MLLVTTEKDIILGRKISKIILRDLPNPSSMETDEGELVGDSPISRVGDAEVVKQISCKALAARITINTSKSEVLIQKIENCLLQVAGQSLAQMEEYYSGVLVERCVTLTSGLEEHQQCGHCTSLCW